MAARSDVCSLCHGTGLRGSPHGDDAEACCACDGMGTPHDEWAAQFTDDEWDAVIASANTGSSDDYSHLDAEDDA